MPVLGWLAGRTFVNFIGGFDHWLALGLLGFVGGRMIWESFHPEREEKRIDITKGLILLTLSIATSVDALAVGLSFAFFESEYSYCQSDDRYYRFSGDHYRLCIR